MAVLKHKAHQLHQLLTADFPHIHAADADTSPVHVKEPGNQAYQSGLSASRSPYHGGRSALGDGEGHMAQRVRSCVVIGK